jgi:NADPH-dependent glutamate synthase beta subunit-like oxidoreductase
MAEWKGTAAVAIIGGGINGASAAYHLARLGHTVEIQEAGPFAGGMMRFGIPKYRLPRDVIEAEVQRIVNLGVTLTLNAKPGERGDFRRNGVARLVAGAVIGAVSLYPAGKDDAVHDFHKVKGHHAAL